MRNAKSYWRNNGAEAFHTSYREIVDDLERVIAETNEHLTDFKIQSGLDGSLLTVRSKNVTVNMYSYSTYPITDARIVVQEFDGQLKLPQERGAFYMREPKVIGTEKVYFDYQTSHGWCWHTSGSTKYLSSRDVADLLVEKLLKLQQRFDKFEIRRDRFE